MNSLMKQVLGSLDPDTTGQIAGRIGASPQQTQGAISAALPLILGAMSRRAATEEGAQSIQTSALTHAGTDVAQLLRGFGGGASPELGQLFGARQQRAAKGLGAISGLPPQGAMQLLSMLAPIVMAAVGRRVQQKHLDARAVGHELQDAADKAQRHDRSGEALTSAVLDHDNDGDIDLQDLMAAAAGARANQSERGGLGALLGGLFNRH